MAVNLDEEIPFFSPATARTDDPVTDADTDDYTTLKKVQEILDREIENLGKDFNSFDIPKDKGRDEALGMLLRQVDGRQEAYAILVPIQEMVKSAVESIEEQRRA